MKVFAFLAPFLVCVGALGQVWQPSPGHNQIPIWPGTPPDAQPVKGPEFAKSSTAEKFGPKPVTAVERVSIPTMTVYSPSGKNTGAAVVVFPGGGYWILAIDFEGTEVCDWLTSKGITCVLLKYRVPGNNQFPRSGPYPRSPVALEDAQRTMGLVRLHAAEWHIDPHKIGALGFSAGGDLVVALSTHFDKRIYAPIDAADRESCRPDFAVPIYPGHLSLGGKIELVSEVRTHITRQTPPTFILQNEDDPVDPVENSLALFEGLKQAGVPAEMHIYAQGGHAFGLRPTNLPVSDWPLLVERWLRTIGVLQP